MSDPANPPLPPSKRPPLPRPLRLLALPILAGLGTLGYIVYPLLPSFYGRLPLAFRRDPIVGLALIGSAIVGIARAWGRGRRLDAGADRVLGRFAAPGLGVGLAILFAGWAPGTLLWPYSRDDDAFAVLARGWSMGIRPYRDVVAYNFPGPIYLHYGIGRLFGWGTVVPFRAVDLGAVAALAVGLIVWSRRRLGAVLPALVAFLAWASAYCNDHFDMVAQRDWYASLSAVLALIWLQVGGRGSTVGSAALAAVGLAIRPQAVLFLPALWAAAFLGANPIEPDAPRGRRLAIWIGSHAGFVLVAFAPLILEGLVDDLARNLAIVRVGGPYHRGSVGGMVRTLVGQFDRANVSLSLIGLALAGVLAPDSIRRTARPWCLAAVGAIVYAPISPVQHGYLEQPLRLVAAVSLAVPVAWMVAASRIPATIRLLALVAILARVVPAIPGGFVPAESLRAIGHLARGEPSPATPAGAYQAFSQREPERSGDWSRHLDLIAYLREQTRPEARVANVLRSYPYDGINGPSGRASPFRCESGLCWLMWVAVPMESEFIAAIEGDDDVVVVWEPKLAPGLDCFELPRLVAAIRDRFQPAARFGPIEVWTRKPATPGS